jgi:hypothetical protein
MWQDSAGTTPAAIDSPVGKINDKSGNGNHATQATAAARPMLREASGLKYLDFDGIDDHLASTAAGLRITGNLTLLAAIRKDSLSRFDMLMTCQTNAASVNQYEFRAANGAASPVQLTFIAADTTVESDSSTNILATAANKVISLRRSSGVEIEIGVNTTTETAAHTKVPTSDSNSEFRLGSRKGTALFFDGRMYPAIVVARRISDSEIANARQYAAGKAGITL